MSRNGRCLVLRVNQTKLNLSPLWLFPPLSQVQVLITDENDCVPEFLQSIYSVDGVPETVTTATSLLQGETLTPKAKKEKRNLKQNHFFITIIDNEFATTKKSIKLVVPNY